MKIQKTNAARILDRLRISYELIEYPVDPDNLGATHVAELLHESVAQVYKTLILKGDKTDYFVCLIATDKEINLKLAAKISHNKNCDLIPQKELLPLTGYVRGGCSPLGLKKPFPIYIDEAVTQQPYIYISAGKRGMQIKLDPNDLITCCEATVTPLTD